MSKIQGLTEPNFIPSRTYSPLPFARLWQEGQRGKICLYGQAHRDSIGSESLGLELPNGIAHHDTFLRTLSRIPTQELEPCLSQILSRFRQDKESISIDEKVLKGSARARKDNSDESTSEKPLTLLNI